MAHTHEGGSGASGMLGVIVGVMLALIIGLVVLLFVFGGIPGRDGDRDGDGGDGGGTGGRSGSSRHLGSDELEQLQGPRYTLLDGVALEALLRT